MKKNKLVMPVVKWVGGKRQLLPELLKYIPAKFNEYYEPFIGGGALLFALQPKLAVINDSNAELINVYQAIKNQVDDLIIDLRKHLNDPQYFYKIRGLDRDHENYDKLSQVEKASRLLYLNKTCFNGLFRVNQAGEFNSPFGSYKNPNIVNEIHLRAVNHYFNNANITFTVGDFEIPLESIKKNSFVYFDPPYDPISNSSNFTGYTSNGFGSKEQIRLKNVCDKLNIRGVKFLLSNSATNFIKDLYKDYKIELVKAKRSINSDASLRGEIDEVLIRNYD
jgi:DNA adenine methylase